MSAGRDLLRARDFADVTVADIATAAGVSVGGFYARYESKEALLYVLSAEVLADSASALERALSPSRMANAAIPAVVRAYVRVMVRKFREHQSAIVQVIRHARAGDPIHGLAVRDFNDRVHGRLRALLRERRADIGHPDPEAAINLGLFFVSAGAREAILAGALRAFPVKVSDDRLIDELTRAYVGYLSLATPGDQSRRR
jgi:AcrR family transcriptional regulator